MSISFHDHINAITGRIHELAHFTRSDSDLAMPEPVDLYDAIGAAIDLTTKFGDLVTVLADRARLMAKEPGLLAAKRGEDPRQLLVRTERALRAASRPERNQLDAAHKLVGTIGRRA